MNRFIPHDVVIQSLRKIKEEQLPFTYEYEKHRLLVEHTATEAGFVNDLFLRLPLSLLPASLPSAAQAPVLAAPARFIILLIQSGHSAIGLFEGSRNLDHKVIRAYMVRKKQGKSQIKHLKTKGKSRAGSRVRLAGTIEFFEEINERLQKYFDDFPIDRIAISCSKTLWPFLFNSKVATPFDKQDERLYRIPRHVHIPKYEELTEVQKFLSRGEWIYEEEHLPLIRRISGEGSDIRNYREDSQEK